MKLYSVRYVPEQKLDGQHRMGRITIREDMRHDKGLLAHEVAHVKQWYAAMGVTLLAAVALGWWVDVALYGLAGAAPWTHHVLTRIKPYRMLVEGWATRVQVKADPGADREALMYWLIGLGMSPDRAAWWVR